MRSDLREMVVPLGELSRRQAARYGPVGIPDDAKGEIPKACVVLKPGGHATAGDLNTYCRQNLAAYKVPRVIEFMDKVPKTASGKTQRFLHRQGPASEVSNSR